MMIWLFLSVTMIQGAPEAGSYTEVRQACREAFRAGDHARLYALATHAHTLRPDDPGALLNLALGAALTGREDEAFDRLGALVEMGMALDLEVMGLAPVLGEDPRFETLSARFRENEAPVIRSREAFVLAADFYPEGIAYDRVRQCYYVGSIHHRRIVRVDRDGGVTDLVTPARDGIWSVMGLSFDPERGELWAASAAMPQTGGVAETELDRSALFRYDREGVLLGRYEPEGEGAHILGDLARAADTTVYLSDAKGGRIFVRRADAEVLVPLIDSTELRSVQGLALSGDERTLYIADYSYGLFALDLGGLHLRRLVPRTPMITTGIDGLVRHGDHLIGIQNGVRPNRVARWRLGGEGLVEETVLEANHPRYDDPTLGVVVADELVYVAASHWPRYDAENRPLPAEELTPVVILALPLGAKR